LLHADGYRTDITNQLVTVRSFAKAPKRTGFPSFQRGPNREHLHPPHTHTHTHTLKFTDMTAYGDGGTAHAILELSTTCTCVDSLTPRTLMGGRGLHFPGIDTRFLGRPVRSMATVMTEFRRHQDHGISFMLSAVCSLCGRGHDNSMFL
jgi:hypothetical protein